MWPRLACDTKPSSAVLAPTVTAVLSLVASVVNPGTNFQKYNASPATAYHEQLPSFDLQ